MTALHKPPTMNTKLDTTVAYQVGYYPWSKLSSSAGRAIAWHRSIVMTKEELLSKLNEQQTEIFNDNDQNSFEVRWEYNNIPTQKQWHSVPADALIRVQYRISSLVGGSGRVAILTLLGITHSDLSNDDHGGLNSVSIN